MTWPVDRYARRYRAGIRWAKDGSGENVVRAIRWQFCVEPKLLAAYRDAVQAMFDARTEPEAAARWLEVGADPFVTDKLARELSLLCAWRRVVLFPEDFVRHVALLNTEAVSPFELESSIREEFNVDIGEDFLLCATVGELVLQLQGQRVNGLSPQ